MKIEQSIIKPNQSVSQRICLKVINPILAATLLIASFSLQSAPQAFRMTMSICDSTYRFALNVKEARDIGIKKSRILEVINDPYHAKQRYSKQEIAQLNEMDRYVVDAIYSGYSPTELRTWCMRDVSPADRNK